MSLGLCVKPDLIPAPDALARLHPPFLRSILYADDDLEALKATGTRLWLTVNNEWGRLAGWDVEDAAAYLAARSDGRIWRVSWGNELDRYWKDDPADVPPAFAADLVNRAGPILKAAGIETWSTSVVSGRWMDYLSEMVPLCRANLDGADFHGYGQAPNGFSEDRPWFFGRLRDAVAWIRGLGVAVGGSEYGVTVADAGDEEKQAEWIRRAYETAVALGIDLGYFSYSDLIGTADERWDHGHGLLRPDGTERPAYAAYCGLPEAVVPPAPPVVPVAAPAVVVAGPDPWRFWPADRVAEVLGAPVENVRDHWPRAVEQMGRAEVPTDIKVWAAVAATMRIETGGPDPSVRFSPVREAYWMSEEWRRLNLWYYPHYGRGPIQCSLEGNYDAFSRLIDAMWGAGGAITRLVRENLDAMLDPDVGAAFSALYFKHHGDGALIDAALAGDMTEVRRLVQGGSAGLPDLWTYWNALTPADVAPRPIEIGGEAVLAAAVAAGRTRLGDPYVFGGRTGPRGPIDCSGFYYWATDAAGVRWPQQIWFMNTDALYRASEPISEDRAVPGVGIYYRYEDADQPGTTYPHMGIWLGPGRTLEARFPGGVAEYQTLGVPYDLAVPPGVALGDRPAGPEIPCAKFISFAGYVRGDLAGRVERNAAGLTVPPLPKAAARMTKADWAARARLLEGEIHPHYKEDEAIKDELIRAGDEVLS
jgi:hypothetical protein